MADSTPRGAKTPKPILMKLGMVDYVRNPTPHDNFGGGSAMWVVWTNMWLVTSLSFFSFFLSFFFAFFSARPGRISWPIGTIYTPKCAFPAKDMPFGVSTISDYIKGVNPQKTFPKWAEIGISQSNRQCSKMPYIGHQWKYSRQISHTDSVQI